MDLSFIKEMSGENLFNSNNSMNYVVMKTLEGDITFTYEGDDRLDTAFKDYEKLGIITSEEHRLALEYMNSCDKYSKVDYINGKFVKIERYSEEERTRLEIEEDFANRVSFYNKEKAIALLIEQDYRLELEDIKDEELVEVKQYIKALRPVEGKSVNIIIERPEIMFNYDKEMM